MQLQIHGWMNEYEFPDWRIWNFSYTRSLNKKHDDSNSHTCVKSDFHNTINTIHRSSKKTGIINSSPVMHWKWDCKKCTSTIFKCEVLQGDFYFRSAYNYNITAFYNV